MVTQSQMQGLHKMIIDLHVDVQRKWKYLKEHQKSFIVVRAVMLMLLVLKRYKIFSSMQYNLSA